MNINYSFIIPHKNCPDLLQRCVDSIPERDDVQVVVVDDNSEEGKKPTLKERKNLQVILLDASRSKGAGRARNVGLEHAEGKWLLFADCDDFYNKGFLHILDQYRESDLDVLYFNAESVDTKTLKATPIGTNKLNRLVKDSLDNEEVFFKLRCFYKTPWAKMTRRLFVEYQGISFEETINGNDMMFSYYVGYLAKKCKVIPDKLYVYTTSNKGLTNQKSRIDAWMSRIDHNYKTRVYLGYIGHLEWKKISFIRFYFNHFKKKPLLGIKVLYNHYRNLDKFKKDSGKYAEFLESKRKK